MSLGSRLAAEVSAVPAATGTEGQALHAAYAGEDSEARSPATIFRPNATKLSAAALQAKVQS